MGKGGSKQQTSSVEPWKGQEPFLKDIYQQAQQWFQGQSPTGQYPTFSTVAPFDPAEIAGQNYLMNYAGSPLWGQALSGVTGSIGQGIDQFSRPEYQMLAGGLGPSQEALRGIAGGAGQGFQGGFAPLRTLMGPAMSEYENWTRFGPQDIAGLTDRWTNYGTEDIAGLDIGSGDAIRQMMSAVPDMSVWEPAMRAAAQVPTQAFTEQVIPSLASQSLGAGGFGGSRHAIAEGVAAGKLSEALQRQQAGFGLEAARDALRQREAGVGAAMDRAGTLGGLGLGLMGAETARTGQLGDLGLGLMGAETQRANILGNLGIGAGQLDLGRQQLMEQARMGNVNAALGAAGQLGGQFGDIYDTAQRTGLGYLSQIPSMAQLFQTPGQIMGGVGGSRRQLAQDQLSDEAQRWLSQQQGLLPALQSYAGLAGGGSFGPSQYAFRGSPIAGALGGGLAGAGAMGSLAGLFPSIGWLGGPTGAAAGAGLGALMGIFG